MRSLGLSMTATPSGQESCHQKESSSNHSMENGRRDDTGPSFGIGSDHFRNPDHRIGSKEADSKNPDHRIGSKNPDHRIGSKNPDHRIGSKNPDHRIGSKNPDHRIGSKNPDHRIGSKRAGLILLAIFLTSLVALIIIYRNFPRLDPSERDKIRVPKNLNDAKELASVLSRYREKYYGSVFCGLLLAYVFLQSFAIPGSIFLTVLAGYLFRFPIALSLVCFCSAVGASLCYLLSCLVGRPLILRYCPESVTSQVNRMAKLVESNQENLLNVIIFLRVTPFAPNWSINLFSPLINVPFIPFFFGTLLGVAPPSAVYINAGQTLTSLNSIRDIFSLKVVISISLIALLTISPLILKHFKLWIKSTDQLIQDKSQSTDEGDTNEGKVNEKREVNEGKVNETNEESHPHQE